jgi:hypothetical protein
MKEKNTVLDTIIDDVFKLDSPKIEESRKQQIKDFVVSAVNGDNPITHLAINADLSDNNKGTIVYILTDLRLIKIDISANEVQSNTFPLKTLIGIDRKLIAGDRAQCSVAFQNGSFGLKYSQNDNNITDFFLKLDQEARGLLNGETWRVYFPGMTPKTLVHGYSISFTNSYQNNQL